MQAALPSEYWRRGRWAVWVLGILLSILIEDYWIADEIYPDFPRGAAWALIGSRKDVAEAARAPNEGDDEPLYSGKCRPAEMMPEPSRLRLCRTAHAAVTTWHLDAEDETSAPTREPAAVNWRFRVPDGEEISFTDLHLEPQRFVRGNISGTSSYGGVMTFHLMNWQWL